MPKQFGSNRFLVKFTRHIITVAVFFIACIGSNAACTAAAMPDVVQVSKKQENLVWQQVFAGTHAPRFLEFTAHFSDAKGVAHKLQYWRDGSRRLRRNTDGNVDMMVELLASGEYRYHVLDHRKKIITHIDQANLHRIGQFSSWNDLSQALTVPPLGATLEKSDAVDFSLGKYRCTWYDVAAAVQLDSPNSYQHICWSRSLSIPLKITSVLEGIEKTTWQVDAVSLGELTNTAFTSNVAGYAVVDANQDISPESD